MDTATVGSTVGKGANATEEITPQRFNCFKNHAYNFVISK